MRAVKLAEEELEPWLEGTNSNPLVYDQVWGGLIIKNGEAHTTSTESTHNAKHTEAIQTRNAHRRHPPKAFTRPRCPRMQPCA